MSGKRFRWLTPLLWVALSIWAVSPVWSETRSPAKKKIQLPKQIIAHYRGTEGIAFPEKIGPVFQVSKQELFLGLMAIFDGQAKSIMENLKVKDIPNCVKDKTTRKGTQIDPPKFPERILLDMLFIRKEDIPTEPKEHFGYGVSLKPFFTKDPGPSALLAANMKVPCLPYRIRLTGANTFLHFGKPALANYNERPNGRGTYSAYIKQWLKSKREMRVR